MRRCNAIRIRWVAFSVEIRISGVLRSGSVRRVCATRGAGVGGRQRMTSTSGRFAMPLRSPACSENSPPSSRTGRLDPAHSEAVRSRLPSNASIGRGASSTPASLEDGRRPQQPQPTLRASSNTWHSMTRRTSQGTLTVVSGEPGELHLYRPGCERLQPRHLPRSGRFLLGCLDDDPSDQRSGATART